MATKDPRLERADVSGYNQPKRTPSHPTKLNGKENLMRYLRDKAGTIYEWNEILAENPSCVEVTEEEALLLWQKKASSCEEHCRR